MPAVFLRRLRLAHLGLRPLPPMTCHALAFAGLSASAIYIAPAVAEETAKRSYQIAAGNLGSVLN